MPSTTTVILGAGFGGIATANALRRLLPPEHRVVLVDKTSSFHFGASKPWVMLGHKTIEEVCHGLEGLTARGIELVRAEIRRIDVAGGVVTTAQGSLRGDYLVIALGSDYDMGLVPGLEGTAYEFYSLAGAARLRDALRALDGGDLVVLVPRAPFKCPPAPYEAAMLIHHALAERGVGKGVRLAIWTVEGAPMATAGPAMGKFVRELLEARDIAYHPGRKAMSVDAARRVVAFEDGSAARYDLLIAVPPHIAPAVVRAAGLVNQAGWIPADAATLKVDAASAFRAVFAIGDVTAVPLPGRYKPEVPLVLPKAGTIADAQGQTVASQIASQVLARPAQAFGGTGTCYIETGGAQAVRGEGQFFALPHPQMQVAPPDSAQYQGKLAWMRDWVRDNL